EFMLLCVCVFFFFQAEDCIRDRNVTGVQTCALPISFQVKPGSLFPALHRMEEEGWLESHWGESENNRRAKYYKLTGAGRRQLEAETKRWGRVALAITRTLEAS